MRSRRATACSTSVKLFGRPVPWCALWSATSMALAAASSTLTGRPPTSSVVTSPLRVRLHHPGGTVAPESRQCRWTVAPRVLLGQVLAIGAAERATVCLADKVAQHGHDLAARRRWPSPRPSGPGAPRVHRRRRKRGRSVGEERRTGDRMGAAARPSVGMEAVIAERVGDRRHIPDACWRQSCPRVSPKRCSPAASG
jgi:hypothetical protein